MEKIKLIYAFDCEKQFEFAKISIKTVIKSNIPEDIKFIICVDTEFFEQNKTQIESFFNNTNFEYKIFTFESNDGFNNLKYSPGMFFWLYVPLLITNKKKFMQIDNDTLINTNIKTLYDHYEQKMNSKSILGSTVIVFNNKATKEKLTKIHGKKYFFSLRKYINYGVVLINGDNYRKIFKTTNELDAYIEEKTNKAYKYKIQDADQEWMFEAFHKTTGFISKRYNARIHNWRSTNWYLKSNDLILHYNLYNKNGKFRFLEYSQLANSDDRLNMLINFYESKVGKKSGKKKHKYFERVDNFIIKNI